MEQKKVWKPNCFTSTISNFLFKKGFTRDDENKCYIHIDLGYEVILNFKKREFTFAYSDGVEKFFKTQTELRNYILILID